MRNRSRWSKHLQWAKDRCNYPKTHGYKYYGGKGITCWLNLREIYKLWERDKAENMKQPSLDRFDTSQDYYFNNCQFIEMSENRKRKKNIP